MHSYINKYYSLFLVLFSLLILMSLTSKSFSQSHEIEKTPISVFIEKAFMLDLTPGMSVGVVRGNEVIYSKGFGVTDISTNNRVTPETLFYIASTTKSFTALAAALLAEEGQLNLDTPFKDYISNFKFNSSLKYSTITLRNLLTHTHGIEESLPIIFRTAYSGDFTNQLLLELLTNTGPSESGREFNYGNLGYNITGLVIDNHLKTSWKNVIENKIFTPLGMDNTRAYITDSDEQLLAMPHQAEELGYRKLKYTKSDANMHAAGGHITNVADLSKWLLAHINQGRVNGEQIFPENVIKETHTLQVSQDRNFADIHRYGWGLGWDLGTYDGDTLVHRFGRFAGFRSHVSFMPSQKLGVIVLVNEASLGSFLADFVAGYIYDRLLDKPDTRLKYETALSNFAKQAAMGRKRLGADAAKRASRSQTLPFPLDEYTGEYENPEVGKIDITLSGGELSAKIGLAYSRVEVYNADENKLRVELTGRGEVIKVIFGNGLAEKLIYNGYEFLKTK